MQWIYWQKPLTKNWSLKQPIWKMLLQRTHSQSCEIAEKANCSWLKVIRNNRSPGPGSHGQQLTENITNGLMTQRGHNSRRKSTGSELEEQGSKSSQFLYLPTTVSSSLIWKYWQLNEMMGILHKSQIIIHCCEFFIINVNTPTAKSEWIKFHLHYVFKHQG